MSVTFWAGELAATGLRYPCEKPADAAEREFEGESS